MEQHNAIAGDPLWTYMASDYTYESLGSGKELEVSITSTLSDHSADPEIGQWGEELVGSYLERQKKQGIIIDYDWKNKSDESGAPYDFEVYYADSSGGVLTDYIEVKSTVFDTKEIFEISIQQVKFAIEKKEHFHIFRVFNAGDMEKVKLIRITDLNMRMSQKQVKLCMFI